MSANAILIPNDMSDLCRVCLELPDESQYLDLTTVYDEEENLTYGECFKICTQIDLSAGEGVPHHLCKSCGIELQMSYDFHKKIEESKRVIEQCQKHLKLQVLNDTKLVPNYEQFENVNVNETEKTSTLRLIDAKYVISTDEVATQDISEVVHKTQTKIEANFVESSDANEEPEEVEIAQLKYEDATDNALSNAEINDRFEEHFEIEALDDEGQLPKSWKIVDGIGKFWLKGRHCFVIKYILADMKPKTPGIVEYKQVCTQIRAILLILDRIFFFLPQKTPKELRNQAAECEMALSDTIYKNGRENFILSETETLQIRVCENTLSTRVRSYKSLESEEKADFVEYAEDLNEKSASRELNREEIDVEFVSESNEKDTDDQLAWQENVVAVANKEHLPIEIENDGDEVEMLLITSKSNFIANDSSHDEAMENLSVEEEAEEFNIEISEVKEYSGKNVTERKRHVGSYSCDYCHRVYPNYSRMKTHRRCHEANRPKFSCTQCGRIYATKQARDCHIQTAHDKSGYVCNICDKVFAIRKSLEIHMRYHTGDFPFACTLCDRKFAQACHLTTHINVKHNQIRFSCEFPNCGKFFTSSSSLRNHEYTHSSMPFECEYCGQGYPAKSKLRMHIQRKHGMNMTNDQLENMRVFHIMRSKVNLVQFVDS